MKTTILISVFIKISFISFAQTSIRGTVTDQQGEPLLGVNIVVENSYDGGSTDTSGEFSFISSEIGNQVLLASYIGYKTMKMAVSMDGDLTKLSIIMEEEINKIDGVTISAGAFEASDKKKSVVLRTFDIVTTAGATADITGVMNTLPGTQTVGEEGRLFVRGGAGHEAKTFINGLLVDEPFSQTPQNIPSRFRFSPFLFKGAFFSTGGYSAEYGQALSSVLQLKTYELPVRSQTDISIMSVGADISQTIKKNNTSLYGQVQYTDLTAYYAAVPQSYHWERAPNSINTTLHFKQKIKDGGNLQFYTNYDRSRLKIEQLKPGSIYEYGLYDNQNDYFYSNAALNKSVSERTSFRGGISFTSNQNNTTSEEGLTVENHQKSMHTKAVFDSDISDNIIIKYGGEWILNAFDEYIFESEQAYEETFDYENHLISPFAEADIYFSNNLVARFGARYEYNSLLNYQDISPRTSVAYKLAENSQFSMAYGRFSQLPLPEYLKINGTLKPEKASHYIFNYQYSKEGRIFRSELFYKKYDQLATKEMNSRKDLMVDNQGYGDAKGMEFFWRDSRTFENIDYWVSYSYLDTERKYNFFPYPVMPYYASRHNVSVVYKHFIPKIKSQIGWTYSFASGRPYTDPNTGGFNSEFTKSYNDLSLNYSFLLKPNMIIHASVSNVFGFSNVFSYKYNIEPNDLGVYESAPIGPAAKRFFFIGYFITLSKDKNANQLNNL